jgi:hypothetical protein
LWTIPSIKKFNVFYVTENCDQRLLKLFAGECPKMTDD